MPKRPYVICHMVPSVDGRIVTSTWRLPRGLVAEYERTGSTFDADAWIIGRVSMEPYAGRAALPARSGRERIARADFVARSDAPSYAIAIDPGGKLRWNSGALDEEHAVTVLTEKVPDRYLKFLRSRGVSYLFGGKSRIDLPTVLRKSPWSGRTTILRRASPSARASVAAIPATASRSRAARLRHDRRDGPPRRKSRIVPTVA